MSLLSQALLRFLSDIRFFSAFVVKRPLRAYQLEAAQAIIQSIFFRQGLTFAVMMSRQAGKNELSAQLEAYLLNVFQLVGGNIVKASPTYKPQTINSILRLKDCLDNDWNRHAFSERDFIVGLGQARAFFFSAQPTSNVVGATANILLECDEAQDVDEAKWHKDFAPMAAAANATTVFYGTAWTSRTLLAKVIRQLEQEQTADGIKRVFLVPWERVAQELPPYREHVLAQRHRLGANHPVFLTQYCLQTVDAQAGMFPEYRQTQIRGNHKPYSDPRKLFALPREGEPAVHAFLIDVAGEDEAEGGFGTTLVTRDYTALTVVAVNLNTIIDPAIRAPSYNVVHRREWLGVKHHTLYATLVDLASNVWKSRYVIIDATGVGAGLTSFLLKSLGSDIIKPFIFTGQSKSQLGWDFLALVDTGRFKDHADDGSDTYRRFWQQVQAAEMEIIPGPGRRMRWGVPDPDIHDDLLISASLATALDRQSWPYYQPSLLVEAPDPLREIDATKGF